MRTLRPLILLVLLIPARIAFGADPDELMPGQVAAVKPGKLAKFVSKPAPSTTFDLPDPSSDPVVQGGTLQLFDTVQRPNGAFTFALIAGASHWKALGNPAGSKGYKYKGAGTSGDPCKVVLIKPKIVKAVCKGTGIGFTLPFQGDLGVVLTAGSIKRYCAEMGGTGAGDPAKLFKRKAAPAPTVCPENAPPTDTPTATATIADTATATATATTTATHTETWTPTATMTATATETPTIAVCGGTYPACNGMCPFGLTCLNIGPACQCF